MSQTEDYRLVTVQIAHLTGQNKQIIRQQNVVQRIIHWYTITAEQVPILMVVPVVPVVLVPVLVLAQVLVVLAVC